MVIVSVLRVKKITKMGGRITKL